MHVAKSPLKSPREMHLDQFLNHAIHEAESIEKSKEQVNRQSYHRSDLAAILEKYNRELGNDDLAIENCKKVGFDGSYCVVTGQQLGMMGGPAYTILKGITCLLVAEQANAVPIFWLATEDHDIPEIDHTFLLDTMGNLKKFSLTLSRNGIAIEDIVMSQKNVEELEEFWRYLQLEPFSHRVNELYSQSMAKVLVRLFAGTGMVFLEPKLLRRLAVPFFSKELEECEAIQNILKTSTVNLEKAGGESVIQVGNPTNLFLKDKEGKRLKVRFDGEFFLHDDTTYRLDEMLGKVHDTSELFSCNVAARPVLQNLLLPVIAYVAGPNELAYHRQLGSYHAFHGTSMPSIVPRIDATVITKEAAAILEQAKIKPWEEIPLHSDEIPGKNLHLLRNLFYPHNKPQERVMNWWNFQSKTEENLISECLKQLSWDFSERYYLYL